MGDGRTETVSISPENFDVVQEITFDDIPSGANDVSIEVAGEGNFMYQVSGSFYLPWEVVEVIDTAYPEWVEPTGDLVNIDVSYDRTALKVNDEVTVDVTVAMNPAAGEGAQAEWAIIDLGIPPGFNVNTEDLAALVAQSAALPESFGGTTLEKYEITGRQIILYLGNLTVDAPYEFSYRMTAAFPLRAQTPASGAYDYYNPAVSGEEGPIVLTVSE